MLIVDTKNAPGAIGLQALRDQPTLSLTSGQLPVNPADGNARGHRRPGRVEL